jgi:hypothetical protein
MCCISQVINKGTESISKALIYSIENTKLHLREAIHIFNQLNREIHDRAEVMSYILPAMAQAKDAKSLLLKVMRYDKVIYTRLQGRLGNSLRPILGQFDGYYSLDLSRYNDRVCLTRLLEQSQTHRAQCIANGLFGPGTTGDLSQWGDWSCFRNAFVSKVATHISPDMFNPMPLRGKLHFDFSGAPKMSLGSSAAINDSRCVNVLENLSLITQGQVPIVKAMLRELRDRTMKDLKGDGSFKPITTRLHAEATQLFMLQFYTSLPKREKVYREAEAVRMEGEKLAGMPKKANVAAEKETEEKKVLTILRSMSSRDFVNLDKVNALDDSNSKNPTKMLRKKHSNLMTQFQKALPTLALSRGSAAKTPVLKLTNAKSDKKLSVVRRVTGSVISSPAGKVNVKGKINEKQNEQQISDDLSFDEDDEGEGEAYDSTFDAEVMNSLFSSTSVKRIPINQLNESSTGGHDHDAAMMTMRLESIDSHSFCGSEGFSSHTPSRSNSFVEVGHDSVPASSMSMGSTPATSPRPNQSSAVGSQSQPLSKETSLLPGTIMAARGKQPGEVDSPVSIPLVPDQPRPVKKASTSSSLHKNVLEKHKSFTPYDEYGAPLVRQDTVEERIYKKLNPKKLLPSDTMEYLQEFSKNIQDYGNDSAKAAKLLDALIDVFNRVWILARHLAVTVAHFTSVNTKKTEFFGTYRVDLVVALFGRVTDVHNFDVVLNELTPFEIACVRCRLGILNIFNPLKPEGDITLNLCNRDERMVAKILVAMSLDEPGDNWVDPTFRWSFEKVPVPGWMLTLGWLQDAGMPTKGILSLQFYSGEGKRLRGCVPEIAARKSYLACVRIHEQDLINDTNNKLSAIGGHQKIHTVLVGAAKAKVNSGTSLVVNVFRASTIAVIHFSM